MATEAQINANRENAQKSTGPTSEAGARKSSHNAVKTGLTGRTILLPTDDVTAYENFVTLLNEKHQPANDYERHLVQSIADTEWRLLRIPSLEAATFALGRRELANEFADEEDEPTRAALIEALVLRTYKKDLSNLALQERRLRGQLAKHLDELKELHAQPGDPIEFHRRNQLMQASQMMTWPKVVGPASAAKFGFEITTEYLDLRYDVWKFQGLAALPKFDRDWQTNLRKKAA
jgi:hypothetical protein